MNITLSESFKSVHPHHRFVFGLVKDISISGPSTATKKLLDEIYPEVRETYTLETIERHVHSKAYRAFAETLGFKRFGFPYLQIMRVLNGGLIGNINNVVNTYMRYELLHNLSIAAYDYGSIEGQIVVDKTRRDEHMVLIGGKEKTVHSNDLVVRDEKGVFYSFSQGYADRTKITRKTKDVVFAIDVPKGVDLQKSEEIMKQLCRSFSIEYDCLVLQ